MVAFLAGPSHFALEDLERILGSAGMPLDDAVRGALGEGRSRA